MTFLCDSKYIILPASFHAQKKRLLFYANDVLVYDLVVSLDYDQPDFQFPLNVERFADQTLRLECEPAMDIRFEKAEQPQLDYSGKYRPYIHFTSQRGWINDPNGLIYHNGTYLLYYQHNPVSTTWENMHWGSAESKDLFHWTEKGDVLFPDENGTIFSGCGIIDHRNLSGLGQNGEAPLLFFYTCAGGASKASAGKRCTQNLAYSIDGGKTLLRYPKPIVEQLAPGNRDPKVIYYEPDDCYIMVMFLEGHEFAFLRSNNLLDWQELQRMTLPDDAECPDFYPLPIDGENGVKWVFSAASDWYCIGSFDGKQFTAESKPHRLNYGDRSYAAQSWSDAPNGRRIRTAFITAVIPGMPFGNCLDIPQEVTLKRINGELALCVNPVEEIRALAQKTLRFDRVTVNDEHPFTAPITSKACDIELSVRCAASFTLSLFGLSISYDAAEEALHCGELQAHVKSTNGCITLRILYDTVCAELFAESGSVFMGIGYIQDYALNRLELLSTNAVIEQLSVSELENMFH